MTKIKDVLLFLKKIYKYFTIWVLTLSFLYYLGDLEDYYFDLVILHLMISVLTLYIVYIHPQKLVIDLGVYKKELTGRELRMMDIVFHHLPLILLLANPGKIKKSYLMIILPLLYRLIVDPIKVYGVKDIITFLVYISGLVIYLLF